MFQTLDTASAELKAAFSADETELECLRVGAVPLEVGLRDELISDEILEERPGPPEEKERWAERDLKYDTAASGVAAEILRRSELMGTSYPFELSPGTLRYRGSGTLVYEFCLAIASAPSITEGAFVRLPRNFERVVAVAMACYAGGDARRIGAPTDEDDPPGYPSNFTGRILLMQSLSPGSNEWVMLPEAGFEAQQEHAQDMGLDIVVWKAFPDGRAGRMTMIGQCACGKHDITSESKMRENSLDRYQTTFRRMTWAPPLRFYAIPFHLPNEARFRRMHSIGGLALDRARIAMLAEGAENRDKFQPFRERFEHLIGLVVPGFQAPPPAV